MAVMTKRADPSVERIAMLALFGLGLLACVLGIADPPPAGIAGSHFEQALDLIRLVCTTALALGLLLGPGTALRVLSAREQPLGLAFLPLPGLIVMAATGALAWLLGGSADPRAVCAAVLLPVLAGCAAIVFALGDGAIFDREERRTLLTVGCVLGIAIGRALWYVGPVGELYSGTVSKTLEVGDRSDSRISFIITQLIAHHEGPYGSLGGYLFAPYNFSSRGPVPGLGAAPVSLLSGAHPYAGLPENPWTPFDREGFVAYRVTMMALACTAFISLWDLLRRIAGHRVARFGLLLAATTPFLVHEVWFTWPKLLAASIIVMALICVVERRFVLAGLLAGFGTLMHPVALASVPVLALVALWPLRGAVLRRPRLGSLALLIGGLILIPLCWRLVNGSHYDQNQFIEYVKQAGVHLHPSAMFWIEYRLHSLADTVIPFFLWAGDGHNVSINQIGGVSPGVAHFFFQYWTTIPFGFGIFFFPLLLVGLYRALRRWAWPVSAVVVIPFAIFTLYWGASSSGMLREGLQFWSLCLIGVLACEQGAEHFGWLRLRPARVVLILRAVEVVAMAVVPAIATRSEALSAVYWPTDLVALVAMVGFATLLAWQIWKPAPDAPARGRSGYPAR
jgi:hypothetical protein